MFKKLLFLPRDAL